MTRTKLLLTICFILSPLGVLGQQQILNTQYIFTRHLINPAYTGVGNRLQAALLVRDQWRGIDGAPKTQALSLHAPINFEKTMSLGGIMVSDKIGVTTQRAAYLTASYKLKVKKEAFISFGLQGGILTDQTNFSELDGFADDPIFASGSRTSFRPNFGAGVYYYDEKFHVGLSIPNLVEQKFEQFAFQEGSDINRFIYLDNGYAFTLKNQMILDVSTLLKIQSGSPAQFDINAILGMRSSIWVGFSYRSFESFDFLFRLKLARDYYFAYSYDIPSGPASLSRVNTGSHEFLIQFGMNKLTKPFKPTRKLWKR